MHALKFAVGLQGTQKFHPIVKYKHCQISRGARASYSELLSTISTKNFRRLTVTVSEFWGKVNLTNSLVSDCDYVYTVICLCMLPSFTKYRLFLVVILITQLFPSFDFRNRQIFLFQPSLRMINYGPKSISHIKSERGACTIFNSGTRNFPVVWR